MKNYTEFTPVDIDIIRVDSLARLVNACHENDVNIKRVSFFQDGFLVIFDVGKGDAILHNSSYGKDVGLWETIGFPWDGDDVSTNTPEDLAKMLGAFKRGEMED